MSQLFPGLCLLFTAVLLCLPMPPPFSATPGQSLPPLYCSSLLSLVQETCFALARSCDALQRDRPHCVLSSLLLYLLQLCIIISLMENHSI